MVLVEPPCLYRGTRLPHSPLLGRPDDGLLKGTAQRIWEILCRHRTPGTAPRKVSKVKLVHRTMKNADYALKYFARPGVPFWAESLNVFSSAPQTSFYFWELGSTDSG